jgi:hypothetical protein
MLPKKLFIIFALNQKRKECICQHNFRGSGSLFGISEKGPYLMLDNLCWPQCAVASSGSMLEIV